MAREAQLETKLGKFILLDLLAYSSLSYPQKRDSMVNKLLYWCPIF